ncbi:MAG: serine/threonine protein kinase [Chlamydiae bacterium]|nr:serine/threonine protein kinase [Chlamydiota bacterium]
MQEEKQSTELPQSVGRYAIKGLIGRGGMGEVFLAFDPICQRLVALKKIRDDLLKYSVMRSRFLKEAKIAAQLCHPSIVPVHEIQCDDDFLFYTMPYVEGQTLKSILTETRKREKQGQPPHPIGVSVTALMRIFLQICEAISYCHSRGLLHRDLKPENILVGEFGEVLILDWGLAEGISAPQESSESTQEIDLINVEHANLTRPGKVVGTLSYLAPERVDGHPADEYSDIYSLGVILYQMLTLRLPFHRRTLKQYKKIKNHEMLVDALEAAPSREIPTQLSEMAKKCLAYDSKMRYSTVKELIEDVKAFTEGDPKWIFAATLEKNEPEHWEFQENVLLTKLTPVSRSGGKVEWVVLMISKESFTGNTKIIMKVSVEKESTGIGILLSIPKPAEREGLEDGYCIWIGGPKEKGVKLIKTNVLLKHIPDFSLSPLVTHEITIERIEHEIHVYIDGELILTYTNYLPFVGSHVGLIYKDTRFSLPSLQVYTGAPHIMVGCLSIPDAFLSAKDFKKAHAEYIRIAGSFWGRSEGREALFRAGVSLIEAAKIEKNIAARTALLEEAERTFSRLDETVGSPLEYLGKAMIYQLENDWQEEIKSLALALRKFPKHSLLGTLEEHVIFRFSETTKKDRLAAYGFALIVLLHLSHRLTKEIRNAISNLIHELEPKVFFDTQPLSEEEEICLNILILAYWLKKPLIIKEIIQDKLLSNHHVLVETGLYALIYLKADSLAEELGNLSFKELTLESFFKHAPATLSLKEIKQLFFLMENSLSKNATKDLLSAFVNLEGHEIPEKYTQKIDVIKLWTYLKVKNIDRAKEIFDRYKAKDLNDIKSPLYFMYGCYLAYTEGYMVALHHFKVIKEYAYPPISGLLAYFLSGHIHFTSTWSKNAFPYEISMLLKELVLFYDVSGKKAKAAYYDRKLKKL